MMSVNLVIHSLRCLISDALELEFRLLEHSVELS